MEANESTLLVRKNYNGKVDKASLENGVVKRTPYHYGLNSHAGYVPTSLFSSRDPPPPPLSVSEASTSVVGDNMLERSNRSLNDLVSVSTTINSRPEEYNSPASGVINGPIPVDLEEDPYTAAARWKRYQYYSRLDPNGGGHLRMPDHVVPSTFFYYLPISVKRGEQSSIVTIFALWNTMMGTSLLSMPWAIQQAGFTFGIVLMICVAVIASYTANRIIQSVQYLGKSRNELIEFSVVCRHYLGKPGEMLALSFSLIALVGATIVYYVLLTNFAFNSVDFLHSIAFPDHRDKDAYYIIVDNITYNDVLCKDMPPYPIHHNISWLPDPSSALSSYILNHIEPTASPMNGSSTTWYGLLWNKSQTVPIWLLIIVFPLISIKSPTFFAKFNALGTMSIMYLIGFVIYKATKWGIHMDFSSTDPHTAVPHFQSTFASLTGISALAFFIHNCCITILHAQKNPENNTRDLFIAYVLVAGTYLGVGITFYMAFPFAKTCIEDNFLNNITSDDLWAFIGRVALFFQILSVFPLLVYILRSQFMCAMFGKVYPSFWHVLALHIVLLSVSLVFAIFVPQIGTIIRFSGALSGLVYVFTLPNVVYLLRCREQGQLTAINIIGHSLLVFLGVLNFLGQIIQVFI